MRSSGPQALRRPWIAIAIRGWRREIVLTIFSLFALGASAIIAPWGPYFLLGCAGVVLWRRPDLRHRYQADAAARHAIQRVHAAFWLCVVVGRDGAIPTVMQSELTTAGRRHLVSVPPGLHFEALEARAPEVAAALGVRALKVQPCIESARYVILTEVIRDPFPTMLGSPLVSIAGVDLWQPLFLGVADDGNPIHLGLPEHNLLIGGEPGAGKSVVLSTIVAAAALDPSVRLSLLDGKQVELAAWSKVADRFVGPDQAEAVDLLEELRDEMDKRYSTLLHERRRKIEPNGTFGLRVVVIDELAFYLRGGTKHLRDEFSELLRDLVSRGRAAGIIVIAATQKPSHEVVPTWIRDLFAFRLAMRCSSNDASDTILGQGWAHEGFSAAAIEPSKRGVGYLLAEGGVPILLKAPFLSDEDIDVIAQRARELRRR